MLLWPSCYLKEEHLECTRSQLDSHESSSTRNEQAYKFLKNVRGSPVYWQDQLHDIIAMFRNLSIPTWFLTLSASDLHWPEMIQAVAVQFGKKLSQKDVLKMNIADRSRYWHQNPITGVQMFQHRVEAFFSEYLLSDAHPLGHITDYVIKIEFQIRDHIMSIASCW